MALKLQGLLQADWRQLEQEFCECVYLWIVDLWKRLLMHF